MSWIYKFRIGLITILAITLIVMAVAFSILRAVLPHATGYVEEVEQAITSQTGFFVSIGSIDADMYWLTPRLKLLDVVAFDAESRDEIIYFDEAIFSLAIIDSILNLELALGEVSLIGADIVIERYAGKNESEDRWVVQGIELSGDGSKDGSKGISDELITVMENIDFLLLDSDVHWIDHKRKKPSLDFIGVNVVSKAFLGKHSLGVGIQLPDGYGDAFRFVVEIGDLEDLNDLDNADWNVFMEGESVNIQSWLSRLDMEEIPEISGVLDGKLWLSYRNKKASRVSGDISVNSFSISKSVSNSGSSKSPGSQWQTDHFNAKFNVRQLDEGWRLDVTDLVLVKNGRIWGETSDITVINSRESGLHASATYLRIQDILKIPGVFLEEDKLSEIKGLQLANVSGDFYNMEVVIPTLAQTRPEAKGVFKNFDFNLPDTEIIVKGIDGMFHYGDSNVELELLSESVEIDFGKLFRQPVEANAMEGHIIASRDGSSWKISSSDIHVRNSDVETNTRVDAIVKSEGTVFIDMQTDFVHADVASLKKYYPVSIMSDSLLDWLDNGLVDGVIESGSFIMHGDMGQFPYANNDGVMEVLFNSRALTLHFLDGWPDLEDMTGDFRFYNSSFSIENGTGRTYKGIMKNAKAEISDLESPRLLLQGEITAPVNELQQYVWNSGLDEFLGTAMRQFQAKGEARLDISLDVPLDDRAVVKTKGKINFTNNELYFPVMGYTLSDVNGELFFVDSNMFGSDLSASFEGALLKINVVGNGGNLSKGTLFDISGNLPVDGMLQKFDWIPDSWFNGSSDWDVSIRLPGANDQYSVKIDMQSRLDGIKVDMSDALSKASDEVMPVSIGIKTIDNILQANVNMNDVMRLFGTRDDNEEVWDYFVDSSLVKGNGKFAEDLTRDVIAKHNFEHIDLLTLFSNKNKKSGLSLAPTFFPPMDVRAENLTWDNWEFSNVHVETSRYPQGMLFNSLSLKGPSVSITGQGSWLSEQKNQHESNFKFKVNSNNFGHTLSTMGFTDGLSQGEYEATVDWKWPAEPYGFSLSSISGSTNFVLKEGQVKDVKPGTGGRVLGLLNVFKLHERLMFNFGDVYKEGFSFDSVIGDFEFHNGNAITENVELKSSAADIGIIGRIGIVEKDYDLVMLTRPHSSEALFTTGWLVAGPVISSGLVILKKLFGVDEMLRDEYTLTGSWDDPVVTLVSAQVENPEKQSDEENDDLQ